MGMAIIKTHIEYEFDSVDSTRAAIKALSHEGKVSNRSITTVTEKGKMLSIDIEAKDVVALRASMNAYLRALSVFEGVEKHGGKKY